MPEFAGSPVNFPGYDVPPPAYWIDKPVHFLPGGYINGRNTRLNYLGKNRFNYLQRDMIHSKLNISEFPTPVENVLDIGSGGCFLANEFGSFFPDANVIGVELSANYVRMCRMKAAKNVHFYQADGRNLSMFADETFDVIGFSYVLHEMPATEALKILKEINRLLKPGGVMTGFEVSELGPIDRHFLEKIFDTGPEPYYGDYEENFKLQSQMKALGMEKISVTDCNMYDCYFYGRKPFSSSVCPQPPPAASFNLSVVNGNELFEHYKIQTGIGGFFERDCVCTSVTIRDLPKDVEVENYCRWKTVDGKEKISNSTLVPTNQKLMDGNFEEVYKFGPITNTINYTFFYMEPPIYATYDCSMARGEPQYCIHIFSSDRNYKGPVPDKVWSIVNQYGMNPADIALKQTVQDGCK